MVQGDAAATVCPARLAIPIPVARIFPTQEVGRIGLVICPPSMTHFHLVRKESTMNRHPCRTSAIVLVLTFLVFGVATVLAADEDFSTLVNRLEKEKPQFAE